MNDIKKKIRKHLNAVGESTAKIIAAAIGMKDYPSDVVKALSEMRIDAEVECEKKKGKGNEFWYWLTTVKADVSLAGEGEKAQPFDAATKAIRETKAVAMPTDKECCNAAKVVATTAGAEVADLREKIAALELDAKRMLDYLGEKNQRIEHLEADLKLKMAVIDDIKMQLGHQRELVASLTEQLAEGEGAVDVKDAAKGYLLCSPKRKPAKFSNADTAVAKAKAAAKVTGRCQVFALVPVGVATKKTVQAVEFKEVLVA